MSIRTIVKGWIRLSLDRTLVPVARHVLNPLIQPKTKTVLDEIWNRAIITSAEYVESHMSYAVKFSDRNRLIDFALSKISGKGIHAEFGVFRGESINYIANRLKSEVSIYGFDSFEGLREDWRGHELIKGAFSLGGRLPNVSHNVALIKGWFDDTLPDFLSRRTEPFAFVHIDCDTYEACKTVFSLIGDRLIAGTIILFDEYFGYTGWRVGEWKAWQEFVNQRNVRYEYLGFSIHQVAIKIIG